MKNCFVSRKLVVRREIVLNLEKLLCTVKNCVASRKIVVHRVKLFCITKYCCAPCKIVLYHEKSLCIQLNIELCFALVGHRRIAKTTNDETWVPANSYNTVT